MIVAQYSYNKYGPYDCASKQEMFMLLNNGFRFVRGLKNCPIINTRAYTARRTSYLTNFRLELIYE